MSTIDSELKKAFDHVGLDIERGALTLLCVDKSQLPDGQVRSTSRFSFWVPEAYVFQKPAPDSGWLHVDEVLPVPDEEVLAWPSLSGKVEQVLYCTPGRLSGFTKGGFITNGTPTHWMPLPKGPTD